MRRTLESLKTNGDAHCEAETLWLMGRAHCEAGNLADADSMLARALEMVRRIGDRDDEFRILVDQARAALAREDYAAALVSFRRAKIANELSCRAAWASPSAEQSNAPEAWSRRPRRYVAVECVMRFEEQPRVSAGAANGRCRSYRARRIGAAGRGAKSSRSASGTPSGF